MLHVTELKNPTQSGTSICWEAPLFIKHYPVIKDFTGKILFIGPNQRRHSKSVTAFPDIFIHKGHHDGFKSGLELWQQGRGN